MQKKRPLWLFLSSQLLYSSGLSSVDRQIMTDQRFLPEWHSTRAVMLAWPYPHGAWQANYLQAEQCYWELLKNLSDRVAVWLLFHPSLDLAAFREATLRLGIKDAHLELFQVEYDDTWIRDYGPISTASGYLKFNFNGWGGKYPAQLDSAAPSAVFNALGLSLQEQAFVCEGGALETNGQVLLLNANCVVDEHRNGQLSRDQVASILSLSLGLDDILWLDNICLTGDDTDGHIDTMVRFSDDRSLVYAGRNLKHQDGEVLESLHRQLVDLAQRRAWRLFELPSPVYRSLVDGRILPCTYANFLICNQWVFAPVYGLPEDSEALSILTRAFTHHQIVPVRCEALLEQHGSLHCATMQVADLEAFDSENG